MEVARNNSKKRNAILSALCSTTSHPTAEMLLNTLKPEIPELSLGTVYRNLSVLEQMGKIVTVGTVNGQLRYDARTDIHSHYICRKCGCVSDIDLPEGLGDMYSEISQKYGCTPERHSLVFSGLCSVCSKAD